MHDERKLKWLPIMYFMLSGLAFGLSLYLITTGAINFEAQANVANVPVASATGAEPPSDASPVRVVLRRDVKSRVGNVAVIYRGIKDDHVRLDVFIPELDPQYAYRREIDYRSAKQGFRLGGVRFELISAGRSKAKLLWIRRG